MNKKQQLGYERVQQLIADLRNSETIRKQNFSALAIGDGKQVKTYCALGALGCEKNLVGYGVSKAKPDFSDKPHEPPYITIINAYGLEDKLVHPVIYSYINKRKVRSKVYSEKSSSISTIIPHLNDLGRWTFSEIAEWLEILSETGVFLPCSQKKMKDTHRYLLEDIE